LAPAKPDAGVTVLMNVDAIRRHCLTLPQAKENLQWGETLCFKVRGKLFALLGLNSVPPSLTLKSPPERFAELLENEYIVPAPYVGRYKWVSVQRLDALPWEELKELIEQSYSLVAKKTQDRKPAKRKAKPKATGRN
jgi:predicted DNA-binding protein (MmcQ/YjbR family)